MPNGFRGLQKGLSVEPFSSHLGGPSSIQITKAKPALTDTRLDVLAIGDAVVDVIARAEDDFLAEERLV